MNAKTIINLVILEEIAHYMTKSQTGIFNNPGEKSNKGKLTEKIPQKKTKQLQGNTKPSLPNLRE